MTNLGNRIVALIDMDCFFCQVEVKLNPELAGKPLAVIQYSSFGTSSIIAVNYEAREFGVTRHMKGPEAKEKCPNIELVTVPPLRNKPDTGRYRAAGKEVIDVLKKHCTIIERASIDEAYLDITDLVDQKMSEMMTPPENLADQLSNSFIVGYCDSDTNDEEERKQGVERWLEETCGDLGDMQSQRLAIGSLIVENLRAEIYAHCQYRCSAGISYNKILAKLACGLHKPNRQTILPASAVPTLYSSLPVKKVRNFGGKFGDIVIDTLGCNVMADLLRFSQQDFLKKFDEKTAVWLYNIARGIDTEPVIARLICKSIGASKNFPGKQAIQTLDGLQFWANELAIELSDRLEQDQIENQRRATNLTVQYHYYQDKKVLSQSRVCRLNSYKVEKIMNTLVDVVTKATKQAPLCFIGMSAGKFVPIKGSSNFESFFKAGSSVKTQDCGAKSGDDANKGDNIDESERNTQFDSPPMKQDFVQKVKSPIVDKINNKEEVLLKSIEEKGETSTDSEDKKSNSSSTDTNKTLNVDNFKNSFFMNFLKHTNSSSSTSSNKSNSTVENEVSIEKIENKKIHECKDLPHVVGDSDIQPIDKDPTIIDDKTYNKNIEDNSRSALAQLNEIFPDLDNIDSSVVQLLPIELQRAASVYIKDKKMEKSENKQQAQSQLVKKIDIRNSNVKSTKKAKNKFSKKNNHNNSTMYNFVIKNSSDINDFETERCAACNQMIKLEKISEHMDFHVAMNLQRTINQSLNSDMTRSNDLLEVNSAKRKVHNAENSNITKKSRHIEEYIQ